MESIAARLKTPFNDEWVVRDSLGHHTLAMHLGARIFECDPPYVIGIQGSWGSGKTSFLRKLWAYLGGETDATGDDLQRWYPGWPPKIEDIHPIWFNPWHHQFESNPAVALLQEIRRSFSAGRKVGEEARKTLDMAIYSAMTVLHDLSSFLPKIDPKKIMDRGREYEAEHFSTPLSSQSFREFFEAAITQAMGGRKRMVVFIDDLDRCEGDVTYRLLESLKLYLNAKNCIYVLALDQKHLEETVSRVLSTKEDHARYRPLAREYLGKMFQCQFLLPITRDMKPFIAETLNIDAGPFTVCLETKFALKKEGHSELVNLLDRNLPHNPRKVKGFIAGWKLYLYLLSQTAARTLNWRLATILTYLAQFEEPLYRKVEEAPAFFSDVIVPFCLTGAAPAPYSQLFDGLQLAYGTLSSRPTFSPELTESFSPPFSQVDEPKIPGEPAAPSPAARVFWIADAVRTLNAVDPLLLVPANIERHLLFALPPAATAALP